MKTYIPYITAERQSFEDFVNQLAHARFKKIAIKNYTFEIGICRRI